MISEELKKQLISKYEKEYNDKSTEELKEEIKNIESGVDFLKKNVKLIKVTKKLFKRNPKKLNPTFQYENDEEYILAYRPIYLKQIDNELEKYDNGIESAEFKINYLKTLIKE